MSPPRALVADLSSLRLVLNLSATPANLPAPVNLTALGETDPFTGLLTLAPARAVVHWIAGATSSCLSACVSVL